MRQYCSSTERRARRQLPSGRMSMQTLARSVDGVVRRTSPLSAGGKATTETVLRSIGTCLTIALLLSSPALAAKAPKAHPVVRNGQSESAHHPHAQAKCDVAAHETDGTKTCLV